MTIKDIIEVMKDRPQMYIGEMEMLRIDCFLKGFRYSNLKNKIPDEYIEVFPVLFHEWIRKKIEEKYKIILEEHRDYCYYIQQINVNEEERVQIFFELSQAFFEEMKYSEWTL